MQQQQYHEYNRWWLIFARRFCVFNAGLKVDADQEILTVIMTPNDENVHSCKRHTVVRHAFCFWRSLCPFLASRLTTVSLDNDECTILTLTMLHATIYHFTTFQTQVC